MRTRAIADLAQLTDEEFFARVAEGWSLLQRNAATLASDARGLLEAHKRHSATILAALSEEEAAKCLILLDALRCPKKPQDLRPNHLRRFNNHLAKGIYAESCRWRPETLGQLQSFCDMARRSHYLDGPNQADWIASNSIVSGREADMYVDYVETDEGHSWQPPIAILLRPGAVPALSNGGCLRMVEALGACGFSTPDGLACVGKIWRSIEMRPTFARHELEAANRQTLQDLAEHGLLAEQPTSVYELIWGHWQFPMYSLDLSPIQVSLSDLRAEQARILEREFNDNR